MKVRISYSIDIEDIPKKSEELGREGLKEIKKSINLLSNALDLIRENGDDYAMIVSMLDKSRSKLTESDMIISDLQAILEGLHNYHNGEKNVSEGRSTLDSSGDSTTKTKNSREG